MNHLIKINNEPKISTIDLNKILKLDVKLNDSIEIYFLEKIEKIDIVFIAGLVLLHKKYNVLLNIKYSPGGFSKRIFEVRQYINQLEMLYGLKRENIFSSFQGITNSEPGDFVASKSFAPILIINKNNFGRFFVKTSKEVDEQLLYLNTSYTFKKEKDKKKGERGYLESEHSVFKKLKEYSSIHTFIFSIVYDKFNPFGNRYLEGIKPKERGEKARKRIVELWEFTQEYVKGLEELAKNIVEHSSTKEGVITLRAYDDIGNTSGKILETHVFDFGDQGIIEKLREDTKKKENSNKVYKEDMKMLNDSYRLADFINPTNSNRLYQQLYRDLAHYGLTKFYRLIKSNEGEVNSTTNLNHGNRDSYSTFKNSSQTIDKGTHYYFQLPFRPELFRTSEIHSNIDNIQATSQTISGLSEVLGLRVHKEPNTIKKGENNLFDYEPTTKEIQSREEEQKLFEVLEKFKNETIRYFSINMDQVKISSSGLLRFMAHLSSNYSQSIIFYNLDFELYDQMIQDNLEFFRTVNHLKESIPYWYENRGILVYSKLNDVTFNFADILFGVNKKEFDTANQLISQTFPNANTIVNNSSESTSKFSVPDCIEPYFYQSSLLPFDVLLNSSDDTSLFQENLTKILSNEINIAGNE